MGRGKALMVLGSRMINPATGIIVFILTGGTGVMGFAAFRAANRLGPKLEVSDLRPLFPWEGWPLPKFTKTKPELLKSLREG